MSRIHYGADDRLAWTPPSVRHKAEGRSGMNKIASGMSKDQLQSLVKAFAKENERLRRYVYELIAQKASDALRKERNVQ